MSSETPTTPTNNGNVLKLRVSNLEDDHIEVKKTLKDLEIKVHDIAITQAKLSERLSLFQIFQATLTGIVGTVATILGAKLK